MFHEWRVWIGARRLASRRRAITVIRTVAPGMLDFAVNVRHARPPSGWCSGWPPGCPIWRVTQASGTCARAQDAVARPARPGPRRGGAAGRCRRRFRVVEQPTSRAGSDHRALVHRAGRRAERRPECRCSTSCSSRRSAWTELRGARRRRPCRGGQSDQPDLGAAHPRAAAAHCAGPAASWWSTRHSRIRFPGEPESLAGDSLPDVLVLRSLTKTWSLAGLRVGYALGCPDVLARLTAQRPHWPVGTLQLTAIAACCAPEAVAEAAADATRLAPLRAEMVAGLASVGADGGRRPGAVCLVQYRRCRPDTNSICRARELPFAVATPSSAWTGGICAPRCARSGRCWSRPSRIGIGCVRSGGRR